MVLYDGSQPRPQQLPVTQRTDYTVDEQHFAHVMQRDNPAQTSPQRIREDFSTDSSSYIDYSDESSDSSSDDDSDSSSDGDSLSNNHSSRNVCGNSDGGLQTRTCLICYNTDVTQNMVVATCDCADHAVCKTCFPKYVANFTSPPVNTQYPYVKCVGDGCTASFPESVWSQYVTPAEARRVRDLIVQCRNQNHVELACPCCTKIIQIGSELIKDRSQSTVIICCNHCNWLFCYHCLEMMCMNRLHELFPQISVTRLENLFVVRDNLSQNDKRIIVEIVQTLYNMDHCPLCTHCERHGCTYAKRPGEINRFILPMEARKAPQPALLRNFEIDEKILAWNVQRILEGVNLSQCSRCRHGLHRTTQCHELSHCGYKTCETCGYRSADFESILIDHFTHDRPDIELAFTCPTFPDNDWWLRFVGSKHRCQEGVCHTDTKACTVPEHALTRARIKKVRRAKHLMSLRESLPQPLAAQLMRLVLAHPKGRSILKDWARMRGASSSTRLVLQV